MNRSYRDRIDDFGRRHLWLTAALTGALAVAATLILLGSTEVASIVYEWF